ncbi:MAG: hypothetical protein Q4F39_03575 [Bacteroidia bacterium]|nr:hypothetical protein [Bacteroidia bacterium]
MKKISFVIPLILLLAVSCNKSQFEISDNPFMLEVKKVQAESVWVDIIPENNDFYYNYGICTVQEFSRYGSDAELVREREEINHEEYDILIDGGYANGSYEEVMLYRAALYEAYYGNMLAIEPETDYYLYAYAFDRKNRPIEVVHKIPFRTPALVHSDITFGISLLGSVVTVTPSDNDQYLFDYVDAADLHETYYDSPWIYYYQMVSLYEQYDFIGQMVSRGVDSDDISDYYDLEPGSEIYLVVSGYDNGITSEIYTFKLTYNGPGEPGTVEELLLGSE